MRVPQSYIQKCKVTAHTFQLIFIFIGLCITIAVLTKDGSSGGATKFYLALCFLTLPGLVYLVMVPMWSRAERFANAYAFVAADALYTIFWFSAFVAVAVYNTKGVREGEKEKKIAEGDGNCTTFKFGPEAKCKLSRATVGFGIVIFIMFIITTSISAYYTIKFRKEGVLPYEGKEINPHHAGGELPNKDNAWSTEIEAHDSDDDDRHTERGGNQEEDEYALLHSTETDEGRHPGRPLSWGDDRRASDGYQGHPAPPYVNYGDDNTSALSPGGYEEYRREGAAHGPDHGAPAPYGAGGQGYSFTGGDR
ncbi:hypothetical protein P154DRAFT_519362 [Amniculicola lignicola CBS 123094]|uniref:MARVEL domain-containing protein n=1 Tax=Amniculicola lignicola CBS 123094 TaxID=1392246 RepID=A0A6A5WS35_9PLEO|nr:hypothetical protein P154DRAFT_519362 [Amniculicola lignicola CBS 123094]